MKHSGEQTDSVAGATHAPAEAALVSLWSSGRLPAAVRDLDGRPIRVVYPGRWSNGYGPDFRGALLQFGLAPPVRGDVEIHVRASDWFRHRHDADPAYDRVLLHVVWHADAALSGPVAELRRFLSLEEAARYSCISTPRVDPCAALSERRSLADIVRLIEAAGDRRLAARASALAGDIECFGADQALYRAMMQALGYSQNTAPFQQLADAMPIDLVTHSPSRPAETLRAASGLAEHGRGSALVPRERWNLARLRPLSHPLRRIEGMGAIIERARSAGRGLAPYFTEAVRSGTAPSLIDRLGVRGASGAALIGRERACVLAVNAVLPLTLALGENAGDEALAAAAGRIWGALPAAGLSRTDLLMREHLGLPAAARLPRTARQQQGLIHLYKRYCRDNLCDACPVSLTDER